MDVFDSALNSSERGVIDAPALRARLTRSGQATMRMCGNSMSPLFPDGTRVDLRSCRPGESLIGLIVAIDWGSKVVVHKVIDVLGNTIHTQGIASRERDMPASYSQVIGVVVGINGRGRRSEGTMKVMTSAVMLSLRGARALKERW